MPAADYHRLPLASKSGLDKIAKSPAHFRCKQIKEQSKAFRIGSATHSLVLEGIAPTVRPEFAGAGSRSARAEWDAAHEGALILSDDEATDVHGMSASIALHPIAGPLLRRTDGRPEVSALWTCPDTSVECKSRFDWLLPREIVDLKTTADASAEAFARSVASFRYHVQDAFYSQAAASCDLDIDQFTFVCVEPAPPYAVAVYRLNDFARQIGRALYLRDLRVLKECRERNEWPAYPVEIRELALPRWATYGFEDMDELEVSYVD